MVAFKIAGPNHTPAASRLALSSASLDQNGMNVGASAISGGSSSKRARRVLGSVRALQNPQRHLGDSNVLATDFGFQ